MELLKLEASGEVLHEAVNVYERRVINDMSALEFDYPANDKGKMINENAVIICSGRKYEVVRITRKMDGRDIFHVVCEDMFSRRAKHTFLPNIPDNMGVKVTKMIDSALDLISGNEFHRLTASELSALGMANVAEDTLLMDFFSVDKTNLWDFLLTVIENIGRGEIYSDGYNFAIVEKIGRDNGVRLSLDKNMQNIDIERDTEDIVTRLWAFGKDDMPVTSANGGKAYIDSENISRYGLHEGYRDYSDYIDPKKILKNAQWEFSSDNPDRIDIPKLSISGKLIDLSKLAEYGNTMRIELGDTVHVIDADGTEYTERVIEGTWRPFDYEETEISIGHIKRDMFYSIYQLSGVKRNLESVSTTSDRIATRSIAGVLNSDRNKLQSDNGLLEIEGDLLSIFNSYGGTRLELGNVGGKFALNIYDTGGNLKIKLGDYGSQYAFAIYDNSGKAAVYMNDSGNLVLAGSIDTEKDCRIQGALRVGLKGSNKGIIFYGDTYVSDAVSDVYAKIVPWTDANDDHIKGINIIPASGGYLWINGRKAATDKDIAELQAQIDRHDKEIDDLK